MLHEKQVREVEAFDGRGAGVLSLYLNAGPAADRSALVETMQRLVRPLADRLDEAALVDLRQETEVMRDYLGSLVCIPEALALFSCSRRHFFRVVRLPVDVTPAAYWSDAPVTLPLREAAGHLSEGLEAEALAGIP
jgi:hypothetical protein